MCENDGVIFHRKFKRPFCGLRERVDEFDELEVRHGREAHTNIIQIDRFRGRRCSDGLSSHRIDCARELSRRRWNIDLRINNEVNPAQFRIAPQYLPHLLIELIDDAGQFNSIVWRSRWQYDGFELIKYLISRWAGVNEIGFRERVAGRQTISDNRNVPSLLDLQHFVLRRNLAYSRFLRVTGLFDVVQIIEGPLTFRVLFHGLGELSFRFFQFSHFNQKPRVLHKD